MDHSDQNSLISSARATNRTQASWATDSEESDDESLDRVPRRQDTEERIGTSRIIPSAQGLQHDDTSATNCESSAISRHTLQVPVLKRATFPISGERKLNSLFRRPSDSGLPRMGVTEAVDEVSETED